jgi:hypothetical protein
MILDERGRQLSSDDGKVPAWATDDDVPLPLGYVRRDDVTDAFVIGHAPRRAVVFVEHAAWVEDTDKLVALAAGAWKAAAGVDCDREMAEFVARCWLMCYQRATAASVDSTPDDNAEARRLLTVH